MTTKSKDKEERFDGVTIVKSRRYKRYADILCLLLDEDQWYTHADIDALLAQALKQPVQEAVN